MPSRKQPHHEPRRQATQVVRALARLYPDSECALEYKDPYQLLVATILSAQCTDVRVNQVTPALFARYPDARALAEADVAELEGLIHSTGFFRSKAKNLRAMAKQVVERHDGKIPDDLESLTELGGVGRKTANVVLGCAFGVAAGVVVDTHVKRLAYRLGLTTSREPVVIERELMRLVPRAQWVNLSHRLIEHGRTTCAASRPRCHNCALEPICPRNGVEAPAPPRAVPRTR